LATPQVVNSLTFFLGSPEGPHHTLTFDFDFGQRPGTGRYNNYTCFSCGEQGCPNKSKEKKYSFKEKKGKTKGAYIAWDENEVSSSSSSSSEDEKANICLVA